MLGTAALFLRIFIKTPNFQKKKLVDSGVIWVVQIYIFASPENPYMYIFNFNFQKSTFVYYSNG